MDKFLIALMSFMLLAASAQPQEVTVTSFPVGVGLSVEADFFKPYYDQLRAIADTLQRHSLAQAVVSGTSDGNRYRTDNDAKNPALALGRAHALRNVLVSRFGVDSSQIIIRSGHVALEGDQYRNASVRIVWDFNGLDSRLETLAKRPPVERHFTEVNTITEKPVETIGLQLGGGLSTSPFGVMPILTGGVTWQETVLIEAVFGQTFWNRSFAFEPDDLTTSRRMVGGQLTVYPFEDRPFGFVVGWAHIEELSKEFHEYVKMSEGPLFGLKARPKEYLTAMIAYNPARQRVFGDRHTFAKYGQFLFSVTAHVAFGGEK